MLSTLDILKKIEEHIEEPYRLEGYEVIRIQLIGVKHKTLQIMIDRLDGVGITLDDCTKVSRLTSILLDQIDPIEEAYSLEISSAGMERPLTKPHHFIKNVGRKVSLNTHTLIKNRKKYVGMLARADEHGINLVVPEELVDGSLDVDLSYSDIKNAKIKPEF